MSKVTSKLQVTLPKAIADRYGVAPGADLIFEPAGDSIRVLIARESEVPYAGLSPADKQNLLDAVARRQAVRDRRHRQKRGAAKGSIVAPKERGWSREELYTRARAR